MWFFWLIVILLVLALVLCLFMYFYIFYNSPKAHQFPEDLHNNEKLRPYYSKMKPLVDDLMNSPCEQVYIKSRDGLKLTGYYYENAPGAPVDLMMHGYKACRAFDFCGTFQISKHLGHNVLMIDERACGKSEGVTVTFGIKERRDCLDWINFILKRNGPDTPIYLFGVSMGAATVMMATDLSLPSNVKAIIADCGYTSPKDIIIKVAADTGFPAVNLLYPFARIGASLFGRFDLEESSAVEAVMHTDIPILIIHGYVDSFVPYYMSGEIYAAVASEKQLLTVENAEHAKSYITAPELYEKNVADFIAAH